MRAGDLRHRVQIQSPETSRGETGEAVQTWTTIATVWAAIEPLAGREYMRAAATNATASAIVRMRACGLALTPQHRILFGDRVFEIVDVANVREMNVEYELRVVEVK